MLPPGSTRVSGRASALLGVAGLSLATHRLLLCGGPTYYCISPPAKLTNHGRIHLRRFND